MFDHFGRRLQRDLKHLVDTRIMTSETMSGGLMRVSARARLMQSLWVQSHFLLLTSLPVSMSMSCLTRNSVTPFGSADRYSLQHQSLLRTAIRRLVSHQIAHAA